ncbi:MAG: hypothetical protein WAW37_00555 [Syntrophobacteraceae bacterium]
MNAFLEQNDHLACILFGVLTYTNYMYRLVERQSLLDDFRQG